MKTKITTLITFLILSVSIAKAQPAGSLDLNFDSDGKVTDLVGTNNNSANTVSILPNGKIVVGGSIKDIGQPATQYVRAVQYDAFGSREFATSNLISGYVGQALTQPGTGRIIVTTYESTGLYWGNKTWGFSSTGGAAAGFTNYQANITGMHERAAGSAMRADGVFATVGSLESTTSGNPHTFFTNVYNPGGTLYTGFSGNGSVSHGIPGYANDAWATDAVFQADGKLIVAGWASNGSSKVFAMIRYNTDGTLDMSFDGDGFVTADFSYGTTDELRGVAMQPDGKIVVVGYTGDALGSGLQERLAVGRLNPDGSPDVSFGTGGMATLQPLNADHLGNELAIQTDGMIVIACASGNDFGVVRLNTNGTLDTNFGINGLVTVGFGGTNGIANAVAIQADNKIVAVGETTISGVTNLALVRLHAGPVGIEEEEANTFTLVSPNPANDVLHVSNIKPTEIVVTNLLGEIILNKKLETFGAVDISTLTPGVYFISNRQRTAVARFVKQ